MTKVIIDISMIMVGTRFTGIPRVVMEVSKRLSERAGLELIFVEFCQKKDCFEIIDTQRFLRFCTDRTENRQHMRTGRYVSFDHVAEDLEGFGQECTSQDPPDIIFLDLDTVWKTRVRRSFLYLLLKSQGIRILAHIYDIIPVTHPQFCILDDAVCFLDYAGAALQEADGLIVNSYATQNAIRQLYSDLHIDSTKQKPVHVIPLGGNFSKEKQIDETHIRPMIRKIVQDRKYLLTVGTIEPRKNHRILLEAYERGLKEQVFSIVIVGFQGWNVEELLSQIKNHPDYQDGIFYPEDVNDDELQYLYRHCFALVFPSLIEGYGLPIMEAMVKGVTVVAADTPINRETGGDCAVYYQKESADELTRTVIELANDNCKADMIKEKMKTFSPPTWENCGKQFYELLIQQ